MNPDPGRPLQGRRALVTGTDVVLAARSVGPIATLAEEMSRCGVRALAIPTDVADRDALQALMTRISDEFGEAIAMAPVPASTNASHEPRQCRRIVPEFLNQVIKC